MTERLPPFFMIWRGRAMTYKSDGVWITNTPCKECDGKNSKALYLTDSGKQYTYCFKCHERTVLRSAKNGTVCTR